MHHIYSWSRWCRAMEIWLSIWKSCGISINFPWSMVLTVLTVLTAVTSVCYGVMWVCMPQRCSAAEAEAELLLNWLLSSAAREMHTCTLPSYVILGKAALLPTAYCSWLSHCLAWVEKFICGLGVSLGIHFCPPPCFQKSLQSKVHHLSDTMIPY